MRCETQSHARPRRRRAPAAVPALLLFGWASACGGGGGPRWTQVAEDLDGALLSVWGTGADDVWVVGADADDGQGPAVLHHDGEGWERLSTGARGDLWWVAGRGDAVWMSGEGGLVLRYDRASGTLERMETPSVPDSVVLFGILPLADDDVWAVGGDASTNTGLLWRYDGTAWTDAEGFPAEVLEAGQLFKIWGPSSDDLWVVGLGGVAARRRSDAWQAVDVPAGRRLLTVHGRGQDVLAVGGFRSGLVVQGEDDALVDVTPGGAPQLNGVWVRDGGDAVAVGIEGSVWRRARGRWEADETAPATLLDYHAVYVDPTGGVWAVGGFVVSAPFRDGMLAHYGHSSPVELQP